MEHRLVQFLLDQHDRFRRCPPEGGPDCPDENTWALLEDNLLSPSQRESLIAHISQCPLCRRTASEVVSAWQVLAAPPKPLVYKLRWVAYAMAACLVLAVGAYYALLPRDSISSTLLAQAERSLGLGRYEAARETLDRVLADRRLTSDGRRMALSLYERTYTASATAKLSHKEYLAAQQALDEAMKRGYRSPDIMELRGTALLGTALAMGPSPEDKLTALGFVGILNRRTKSLPTTIPEAEADLAIELLRDAAEQQPHSATRWRDLGKALLSINRYAEAVEPFQRWCGLEPGEARAHNALGLALYAAERYREAAAALGKTISLQPNVPAYEFNAAIACEEAGQLEDAVKHWKRYLTLEPTGAQADEARKWLAILERGING